MDQLIDLVNHSAVGLFHFFRLLAPGPLRRFDAQTDGIQRLQHAVMQIPPDTGAIFEQLTQAAFGGLVRDR
jgi:hypothetical protein